MSLFTSSLFLLWSGEIQASQGRRRLESVLQKVLSFMWGQVNGLPAVCDFQSGRVEHERLKPKWGHLLVEIPLFAHCFSAVVGEEKQGLIIMLNGQFEVTIKSVSSLYADSLISQ